MAFQLSFQCNESWDQMSSRNQGKFCDKCSKNIHDLTDKTQTEIQQLYEENNGNLCGKIKSHQLSNSFFQKHKMKLAKFCFALFLVFGGHLFNSELHAQNNIIDSTTIINDENSHYIIKGKIVDKETKEPVFYANVFYELDSTIYGTTTSIDGTYELKIDPSLINGDFLDLNFSALGYKKMKITGIYLSLTGITFVNLELEEDGLFEWVGVVISCPPIIDKDPESHGRTTITRKEIRRSPY